MQAQQKDLLDINDIAEPSTNVMELDVAFGVKSKDPTYSSEDLHANSMEPRIETATVDSVSGFLRFDVQGRNIGSAPPEVLFADMDINAGTTLQPTQIGRAHV